MLTAIKQHFEQSSKRADADLGNLKHPSDKDRAERFSQRLKILLKDRAQAVSKAFQFNKFRKITTPQDMPAAPELLKINPETYESILDLIGENKPIFDINLQKTAPKASLNRRLFMTFVPFK